MTAPLLKVVTINVWSGLDYHGIVKMGTYESACQRRQRYQLLLQQLEQLQPDVIGLNEANPLPRYARELARALNYDYVYHLGLGGIRLGPCGLPINLREGEVLLARKELQLHWLGRTRLSGGLVTNHLCCHFTDATQIIAATIQVQGRRVLLCNTHWHADMPGESPQQSEAWRQREAHKTIAATVQWRRSDWPAILLGDFNAGPQSPEIQFLLKAGWYDCYACQHPTIPGWTWDPTRNSNIQRYYQSSPQIQTSQRLDYIFVNAAIGPANIRQTQVVFQDAVQGVHPSDHFGVCALVAIPPRSATSNPCSRD